MDDRVIAWALRYVGLGWHVVPIAPGSKHPALKDWPRAATCDPEIVQNWWTGLYRGHGVGIVTGRISGVWVLDVDPRHGGDETLAALIKQYGPLPATATVRTGSGGHHYYWTVPFNAGVVTSRDRLGPGLDVRGEGGQVVAPPTLHKDTGEPYVWEASPWTPRAPV